MLRCSDAICQLLFWPLKISPGPATSDLSPLVSVRYHNIKIKYPFSFLTWKHAKISRPLFCCMLWVTYQTKTTFPILPIIFILFTVIWIFGWYLVDIYCLERAPALFSLVCLVSVCLSVRYTRPATCTVYYVLFSSVGCLTTLFFYLFKTCM